MQNEEHQMKVDLKALSLSPMIPAALATEMFKQLPRELAACSLQHHSIVQASQALHSPLNLLAIRFILSTWPT